MARARWLRLQLTRTTVAALAFSGLVVLGWRGHAQDRQRAPQIGEPVTSSDFSGYFAIQPDGRGLPPGGGDVKSGEAVFSTKCAGCHGQKLQGIKLLGAPALKGGRGTLTTVPPNKTVESYWPYATTLFDYVKRAMPFNAPGSLDNDQVYAVCAYILEQDGIVPADAVLNMQTLPKVKMPNRDGFRRFHDRGSEPNP